jgi:hypothetical protein
MAATLGLAAASWIVAAWQMHGMHMGPATRLGSFPCRSSRASPVLPRQRRLWIRVGVLLRRFQRRADADAGCVGRHERHWMTVIAVLVLAQKLLSARAAANVRPALAIVGLGILIVIAPSSVPGFTPPMRALIGDRDPTSS